MKVVIIGGVAGGATAAARLRRLDEKAQIIMFEKGPYVSYAACGLPYFLNEKLIKDVDALVIRTPEEFRKKNNIDVRVGSEVTSIDREGKKAEIVEVATGKKYTESYDKLIISTGSFPFRPNIPGIDAEGVFTLWSIPDAVRIREYIREKRVGRAAIVGGGAIGLEAAENLAELGIEVTIIELSDHLIAPIDADMALPVLNYVTEKGIKVILNDGVTAIEKGRSGLTLKLKESMSGIEADMVLMSVGARPRSELAKMPDSP